MDTTNELKWIVVHCTEPGCNVAIRTQIGESYEPRCTWHRIGTAYNVRPKSAARMNEGPLMTKEEFGLDLYEAIRLQSHMQQYGSTPAREAQLLAILNKQTIAPDDVRRILAMRTPA